MCNRKPVDSSGCSHESFTFLVNRETCSAPSRPVLPAAAQQNKWQLPRLPGRLRAAPLCPLYWSACHCLQADVICCSGAPGMWMEDLRPKCLEQNAGPDDPSAGEGFLFTRSRRLAVAATSVVSVFGAHAAAHGAR